LVRMLARRSSSTASATIVRMALLIPFVTLSNPWAFAQASSTIPAPLSVVDAEGTLQVTDGSIVSYPQGDAYAQFTAQHLVDLVKRTRHIQLVAKAQSAAAEGSALVVIARTNAATDLQNKESYDVEVTSRHVTVSAAHDAGLFYGTVTLWQMLTASTKESGPATLRCVAIHDQPQMAWRGIMLDSARHMQSIGFIHELVDWMSLEKLNVLHWHLTDDQGWRLEIKRYPRLATTGGWRELPSQVGQIDPATGKAYPPYGGYYTQAEVRELVAFAAQRNVTIVPEIEMPGHASAALAAYPEFGVAETPITAPENHYGIFPNLYNVNDATFTFIENVLTEVMQLFPSEYIHIGGDEAIKDQWKASPAIQAQMKRLGISNEDELQSYFVKQIDTFLTAHHRRTLGWDEILQGGLAPNAAVMSWHGVQGGIDAAKQGHDAVLTPVRPLYFNYRQSDAADEAPGRFALNTLEDVYRFNPSPDILTPEERKHIIGVQGNLWSEYMLSDDRDAWMLFPRAAALAEIAWSSPQRRDWNDFEERMVAETHRYHELGIGFDPDAFRVKSAVTIQSAQGAVSVVLATQTGFGNIRYTTDGSPVTNASAKYEIPLDLKLPTHLRAAAFRDDELTGSAFDEQLNAQTVRRRYSQELKQCSTEPVIAMEPDPPHGERPVMLANYKKLCWIYEDADLAGVTGITADVVPLPYVFQDRNNDAPLGQPLTSNGELAVHLDTCAGQVVATLAFGPDQKLNQTASLQSQLSGLSGKHDLCLTEARPQLSPFWTLDWVQLGIEENKR